MCFKLEQVEEYLPISCPEIQNVVKFNTKYSRASLSQNFMSSVTVLPTSALRLQVQLSGRENGRRTRRDGSTGALLGAYQHPPGPRGTLGQFCTPHGSLRGPAR